MAVRNMEAGRKVKESIMKDIPNSNIDVMRLNLSSMASVRSFASEYISKEIPLNILINNAGLLMPFTLSEDNIELQFATNHIGHFLLAQLLLDTTERSAGDSNREGRIVNVTSEAHCISYREGIRFDRVNDESGYKRLLAYGQSKLANILHAHELARRLKENGANITVNSIHPGIIVTNMVRYNNISFYMLRTIPRCLTKTVEQGAATTCYVALNPQVNGVSGEYFVDCNMAKPSSQARDAKLAKRVWDFSFNLTNPK